MRGKSGMLDETPPGMLDDELLDIIDDGWLEDYSPLQEREPATGPGGIGGRFAGGGGAGQFYDPHTNTWGEHPSEMHMDPAVFTVGGDKWNQKTALRLEFEYQKVKPDLDKLATNVVSGGVDTSKWKVVPHPSGEGFSIQSSAETDTDGLYAGYTFGPSDKFDNEEDANSAIKKQDSGHEDDEEHGDDDEDFHAGAPDEWDNMSGDQQEQAEKEWMSSTETEFYDSEVENWNDSGQPMDDATNQVVQEWDDAPTTHSTVSGETKEWPEWAQDALDSVRKDRKENGKPDIPFTDEQIFMATTITFKGGNQGWGYNDKYAPEIEIDHEQLSAPIGWLEGGHADPSFSGFEQEHPSNLFTNDMHDEFHDALLDKLKSEAENKASDVEPPEYLKECVGEQQSDYWSQMEDNQKFDWTKKNTSIIPDLEEEQKTSPEIVEKITMPDVIDPFGGESSPNYQATQKLARAMAIDRSVQIMKDRGVTASVPLREVVLKIDSRLWVDWKSSSTSPNGKLLQLAIAEELGGRLNMERLGASTPDALYRSVVAEQIRNRADQDFYGGYKAVKAYVRGEWETTQWMLEKSNHPLVEVFRGLRNVVPSSEKAEWVTKGGAVVSSGAEWISNGEQLLPVNSLGGTVSMASKRYPDAEVIRNGAASFTTDRGIANSWAPQVVRAVVPRTAVVSVPAYGQNVYGERETVVAGTAWRGYDVWQSPAPPFEDVPVGHTI